MEIAKLKWSFFRFSIHWFLGSNMSKITKVFAATAATALSLLVMPLAQASYGSIAAPGVYYGTGNFNDNFTISNAGGIELALRAKMFGGASYDGSSGIYDVPAGLAPGRPINRPRAAWNYDFSINTAGSERNLSDFAFRLGVDHDPSAATNFSYVNPLTQFPDNATFGTIGAQNSENVIFANTPGGPFNPFAPGLYSFRLQAFSLDDRAFSNPLSQVDTIIRVAGATVPEPTTIALLGLGLLGFAVSRRKSAK